VIRIIEEPVEAKGKVCAFKSNVTTTVSVSSSHSFHSDVALTQVLELELQQADDPEEEQGLDLHNLRLEHVCELVDRREAELPAEDRPKRHQRRDLQHRVDEHVHGDYWLLVWVQRVVDDVRQPSDDRHVRDVDDRDDALDELDEQGILAVEE
jgi:hypothetical protein